MTHTHRSIPLLIVVTLVAFFAVVSRAQWTSLGTFPGLGPVADVLITGDTIYAAVGRRNWWFSLHESNSGLYRSTDEGGTWQLLGLHEPTLTRLGKIGSTLIVGTRYSGGVFTSTDEGVTWVNPPTDPGDIVFSIAVIDSVVYVGGNAARIWMSTDRGGLWSDIGPGSDVWATGSIVSAGPYLFGVQQLHPRVIRAARNSWAWMHIPSPADTAHEPYPDYIFATDSTLLVPTVDGIFASSNYGAEWHRSGSGLPAGVKPLDFSQREDSLFARADRDIYVSTDHGVSWQLLSHFPLDSWPTKLAVGRNIFALGTNTLGVCVSTDRGTNWNAPGILDPAIVTSLVCIGDTVLCATSTGLYRSTNNGNHWSQVPSTCTACMTRIARSGTSIVAGTDENGLLLSRDAGGTWAHISDSTGAPAIIATVVAAGEMVVATELSPPPPMCWGRGCITSYSSFLSTDEGHTWGDSALELSGVVPTCFAMRRHELYLGTSFSGVYRSSDGGVTWNGANTGLGNDSLFALAASGSRLFAGTNNGIYVSSDGTTWWDVSSNILPKSRISALAVHGSGIFAGTYGHGLYHSPDSGARWQAINDNMTDADITALAINDGYLFAGTHRGVWRRPLSEMTTSVEAMMSGLPTSFSLSQNYPNPFNPSTTIAYELPKSSEVRLSVYDLLGREVSVLVNERRDAGVHEVQFDASAVSSGVYFYRLQAGDFVQTRKLLLLR